MNPAPIGSGFVRGASHAATSSIGREVNLEKGRIQQRAMGQNLARPGIAGHQVVPFGPRPDGDPGARRRDARRRIPLRLGAVMAPGAWSVELFVFGVFVTTDRGVSINRSGVGTESGRSGTSSDARSGSVSDR